MAALTALAASASAASSAFCSSIFVLLGFFLLSILVVDGLDLGPVLDALVVFVDDVQDHPYSGSLVTYTET